MFRQIASYTNSGKSNYLVLQLCNFLETLELPKNESEEKLRDLLHYPKVYFFSSSISKQDILDFSHVIKKSYLIPKIDHFVEIHNEISMNYLEILNMQYNSLVLFEDIRIGDKLQEVKEVVSFFRKYRCTVMVSSQPKNKDPV